MMSNNSHCGPDIVKYFVVEPANDAVTGATGNFFVCSGTTFLSKISGCTDSVDFNGNTFYNNSDVFFNGVITACTGIHTSNIYGCSPITVNDELILLSGLTLNSIYQDNSLTQILVRDGSSGLVKYRDVSSIAQAAKLQNTYFVSSLSGNNSTALVGDINNPWKTITEARNQAVADGFSNSLIHIYSGEYLEDEIQYENGNFYFEPNSKVTTQRTASGGTTSIFKLGQSLVYESNAYSANTCNVYGYGDFSVSATTDTDAFGGFILSMLGDSNSYFEFNDAYVHSGEAFYAGGNSTLTLEGHDILLDPSGSDGLDFSDTSTTLINVNDIVGGNSHWNIHYRTSFAGKSVVNFNKLIGSDQLIAFDRFMQPTAEITMNFNLIEHTGGSQYIINSGDNLGAKVTLNGDFYAPYGNGILLFHDAGEYNINGNITCRDTALLAVDFLSPSNDFVLNYNGDIVTSGVTSDFSSNGGIELNKITANLNGSLTNLSLGSLFNGINIDDNSILTIDNFTINVASGNTIGTSSSNVVNINHSLSINKPFSSGITTTGLFNYTGTTNVGDLVIYNTPELNNSATDILVRNSSNGNIEYRNSSTVIPTAKLQNTYFVSALSGDNSTALVGDINSPWETITSARNQVVSDGLTNSLIHVYSGQYVDEEIQYENGNFYFEPNSIVTMSPTLAANASSLFKLGSTLTKVSNIYSATTCNVYGYGKFVVSASTDSGIGGTVLDLDNNSVSFFEFDTIDVIYGLGVSSKGTSTLQLEGNEINVTFTADCIALQQGSNNIINVNKILGGSNHWGLHYSSYSGTSLVNISEILGKPTFQPIGFSDTKDGAEIVINFNKLSHEPIGTQFVVNNSNQQGGKITLNGNIESERGIVYGQTCTGGEFNYNGDIIVNEFPILNSFTGPHNGNTFIYNGNVISNGNNSNGYIALNGGTSILNGSLTNNTFSGTTSGIVITLNPTNLNIGNFDINVNTESITSTASQTVNILHSLNVNKPLHSNITTTGLFNYTGTTNVGDLVIYNTPTNDNTLTQILGRNSTNGDIEYRDVISIIGVDTFVTGFTYNDANTFTISDNSGTTFNATINTVTGLTSTGNIEVIGNIIVTGGTGNVLTKQVYVENNLALDWDFPSSSVVLGNNGDGSIINGTSLIINSDTTINGNLSATTISATTYFGDGSNLTGIPDTFVTGFTFNNSTYDLTIKQNEGEPNLVSNLAALASDVYVVSGVYNSSTGIVTYTNSSGGTFQVSGFTSGMTDSYTTDAYIDGTEIRFDNNIQGANYYNVDLNPLLSGFTGIFTGNTSATCINELWVTNISGCSPVTIGTELIVNDDTNINGHLTVTSSGTNTSDIVFLVKDSVGNHIIDCSDNGKVHIGDLVNSASPTSPTLLIGAGKTPNDRGSLAFTSTGIGIGGDNDAIGDFLLFRLQNTGDSRWLFQNASSFGFVMVDRQSNSFGSHSGLRSTFYTSRSYGMDFLLDYTEVGVADTCGFRFSTKSGTTAGASATNIERFVIENGSLNTKSYFDNISVLGVGTNTPDTNVKLHVSGDTLINGGLTANTINLVNTPTLNNSGTEILVRNSSTGDVEYRDNGTLSAQTIYNSDGIVGPQRKIGLTDLISFSGGTVDFVRTGSGDVFNNYYSNTALKIKDYLVSGGGGREMRDSGGSSFHYINQNYGMFNIPVLIGTSGTPTVGVDLDVQGDALVNGGLTANTLSLDSLPTLNASATEILVRNSSTGDVEYRDVTSISADTNTFVTGFTYDNINTFTIGNNDGSIFSSSINVLSATTISATTYFGDGSNLTGISTDDNYVTGGTYNSGSLTLDRQNGSVTVTGFTIGTSTTVTGFTYNDANTFTISDSDGSNYSASINIMTGLTVNGESVFSGNSTGVVQIYGSGSTAPIFRVQGSSGELFSITDDLTGELFAVNNISGLPILQVHSDNRIILGDNLAPSLYTTAKVTANSGSLTSVYSVPLSAYTGAWFEYTAKGTTSLRAGNIASIFSGTNVNYNETTTTDIGDTSDLLLDVIISGTNATLTASATTSSWEIKTIIRSI